MRTRLAVSVALSVSLVVLPKLHAASTISPYVFLTDNYLDEVLAVNPNTNAIVKNIPTGTGPTLLASSLDGSLVFVANEGAATLTVVDVNSLAVASTIPLGGTPNSLAMSPDAKYLFVGTNNNITVIDVAKATTTPTQAIVRAISPPLEGAAFVKPNGIGLSPDGKLYVAATRMTTNASGTGFNLDMRIYVYNGLSFPALGNQALRSSVVSPFQTSSAKLIRFLSDGTRAYIGEGSAGSSINKFIIMDAVADVVVQTATIPTPYYVSELRSRPDGVFLYGPVNSGTAQLLEFDPTALSITRIISLANSSLGTSFSPIGIDIARDSPIAYVSGSAFGIGELVKVDLMSGAVTQSASYMPGGPFAVMISSPQLVAPARISIAAAPNGINLSSITYQWTAVSAGGGVSTATAYNFRYATFPIVTDAFFSAATQVSIPAPRGSGSAETYTLIGLAPDTTYYVAIKAINGFGNSGPLSNSLAAHTIDNQAPSGVTDMLVQTVWGSSITLTWTAVGDNANSGRANRYDLRYSSSPIASLADFLQSVAVSSPPSPQLAGARETFTVTSLASETTYYFAVRVFDEAGLSSPVSNVVRGTTPDISPPGAISLAVPVVTEHSLTYAWLATGDNGSTGTATSYDFRYATYAILTDALFAGATRAFLVAPRPAGSTESLTLSGLNADTTFFAAVKATDESGNMGPLSNSPAAHTLDLIPPATITTLAILGVSATTATVTWTAVGDNGTQGRATSYDLRYATFPIVSSPDFDAAVMVIGVSTPQAPGTLERATILGLTSDASYFIAIKALDEVGQAGGLSNVVSTRTLDALPPSAISDLSAQTGINKGEIVLNWTAVGDNGLLGRASRYIIKASTSLIAAQTDFNLAQTVSQSLTPALSGSTESFLVKGLLPNRVYYLAAEAVDKANNQGGLSNVASATSQRDLPPLPITNLVASEPSSHTVLLTWMATGDDVSIGRAASYDLRWAVSPIDETSFASATPVLGVPAPLTAGSTESFIASGIPAGTNVYFAIKAIDTIGQASALSNVPQTTTTGEVAISAFVALPETVVSGQGSVIRVFLADGVGQPLPRIRVTFSVTYGGGTISPLSVLTDQNGIAQTTFMAPGTNEVDTISAAIFGLQTLQASMVVVTASLAAIEGFPTTPLVFTGGPMTLSTSSLAYQWLSVDPAGISDNYLMIGSQGDSALGDWVETNPVTGMQGQPFSLFTSLGGYLYFFGLTTPGALTSQYSLIQPDGSLGTWQTTLAPPTTIVSGFVYQGRIYVFAVGGAVYRPTIDATTGRVTAWSQVGPDFLATNRIGFDAGVSGNFAYTIGGNNPDFNVYESSLVFVAQIKSDGSLPSVGQTGYWKQTTPLPAFYSFTRPAPRLVSVGAYLYVIGGKGAQTVFFARPNADGTIPRPGQYGTWAPTTPLTESNDGLTAVGYNGAIYLVGGSDGVVPFRSRDRSFRAVPNADGTIPPVGSSGYWKLTRPLPGSAIGRSAVAGNRIYSLDQASGKVRFAEVQPSGNLGSWRRLQNVVQSGPLAGASPTQRRSFAWSSVPVSGGNRVYLAGGVPQGANAPVADVFSAFLPAPFVGTGGSGVTQLQWTVAQPLPRALRDSAAVQSSGAIYVLGGLDANGDQTDAIYSAVATGGSLQWSLVGHLPQPFSNLVAGVVNGYLYVTGVGLGRADVYGAPVGSGGAVGTFTKMASLPTTTLGSAITSVLGHRGYLYVCVGNQAYSAVPDAAGVITQWRVESGIPSGGTSSGPFKVGLVASNETLYAIGGAGDTDPQAIYSAQIGVNGVLGQWRSIGHMSEVRNTGVAILNDDQVLTFGPRMDAPPLGQIQSETGTYYTDTLTAPVHLSGSDVFSQSVGTATDFFGTNLSLLRGQMYYASIRTKNPTGFVSRPGVSDGTSVAPPASPPDMLPPRTTLHISLPSSGANPTFISPQTRLTFTSFDDRVTVGDDLGDGTSSIVALLDGVVISTDPAAVITITTEGPHVFSFYGTDLIGNTESIQQLGLISDGSPPVTQIISPLAFDVLAGSYTLVQGVAADTFTFIDRVLVSADNDVSFSTAVIVNTINGLAYWQLNAPLPTISSTITFTAHAVDLVGNYDAAGSSVPVFVFNVVNTTMAIAANPRVVSPGSLVQIQTQVATQLGGPLQGAQVVFSAVVSNTLDAGSASGGVPLPAISFAPSVAVTDAFGIATTTLAIGGFDGQFTALVDQYAAAQFCIQAAPIVGMTPGACPSWVTTTNVMASYMLQAGISNGTLTTQAQVDSVQAQMGVIAQEQFQAASSAIFNKSIGLITVTAQVQGTLRLPFVSSTSIRTSLLSLPYPVDLTGLPTNDTGEQPNSITYGDNNTATAIPLPGQTDSTYGRPLPDSQLIAVGQANSGSSGGIRVLGFIDSFINDVNQAANTVTNFLNSPNTNDSLFMASNMAVDYMFNSTPGSRLVVIAAAYGMDLLMGNHESRDLVASSWGDRAGMSLADLSSFGILPPAVTNLIPPGLSVGLDVSGALAGKPIFGVNAGLKTDSGLSVTYNSSSGLNLSQQIDGLQTNFSKAGFTSSINLGSLIADQPLGQLAQQYGLKSLSVGLLSGDYTGRMQLDIAKVSADIDKTKLLKALGAGIDTGQYSMSSFGSLFSNLPSWSAGAAVSFRDIGISFSQSSLFGSLGFGKISFPKPPSATPSIGQKIPIAPSPEPRMCSLTPSASSIGAGLFASANAYQSLSVDNGYFTAANTISGMTSHPVNSATGNLLYSAQDALVKGKPLFIQLVRIYNSLDFGSGPLGNGWSFNYGMSVSPYGQAGVIAVKWGDGSRKVFLPNADGTYRSPYATLSALSKNPDETFTLTQKHGTKYHFNAAGRLDLITDKNGNAITLVYSGADLSTITDSAGKSLTFVHDARGRITQMTDPSGAVTNYTYNGAGDLVQVGAPGYAAIYGYDAQHGLTSYQDTRSQTGFPKGGFSYTEFRQVSAEFDSLGNRVSALSYALVNNGIKTTVSDVNANQTVDLYDSTGAWISRTNPLGGVSQFVFNAAGLMTRVTEPDGAVTQLSYDSKGNKTSVVDPAGAQFQYSYDARNSLVSALLPNAGQISRTYDAAGNLTSVTDAEGGVSHFTYNAAGLMLSYKDANGKTTSMSYDASGNLAVVTRPGGGRRTLSHDALGRLTATTDENGNTTSFGRTAAGYLAAITYPEGQTYTFAYDANGRLARETDQMGKTTNYVNDERGLPVQIADAAGVVSSVEYDAAGRLTRRLDRNGAAFTKQYDALNRITQDSDPRGGTYHFTYDAAGRRTAITDPTGSTLSLAYDRRGRPVTITSPEGSVTSLAYDAMGNLLSQTDPNGGVTAYVHDKTGLVTKVTDAKGQNTVIHYDSAGRADTVTPPNGAAQSFAYNPDGFLVTHTDGGGRSVHYTVDSSGRLTSTTDGLNRVTQYAHRWNGQVTSLTRADGSAINFAYDARGALSATTDANGNVTRYDHTDTGHISKVIDAKGNAILYGYDAVGRPTSVTYPDGTAYHLNYDGTGLLTSFTNQMGKTHSYTYDLSGQILTEKDENGGQWGFVYDRDGRMTDATDPAGGSAHYTYDHIGNVLSQTNPNGGVTSFVYNAISQMTQGTDPAGGVVKFTYDGVGNLLTKQDANGHVTTYAYNSSNDLVSITDAAGSIRSFVYDLAGQVTSATGPLGDVTAYAYDLVGRLARHTGPTGAADAFTYDAMGNRLTATDPLGHLTSYVYDALNRMVSITDLAGTRSMVYDALGRVLSQTDAAGHVTQFVYQADGLPTSRVAPDGATTHFEYDGNGNMTATVDASGNRTTGQYDALNRATRAIQPDGSVTLAAFDANGNPTSITDSSGRTTTFTYDAMNRLVSRTDSAGNLTTFAYDPAGNQTEITDPAGKISAKVFDALNRLLQTTDPVGNVHSFTYDAAGNQLTMRDPAGAVTRNSYDLARRRIATTDPLGNETHFIYDAVGNLLTTTDPLGHTVTNTYDSQGRLVASRDSLGRETRYAYDANGNRTALTDPLGNVSEFRYDANDRLISVADPLMNKAISAYDANGNKISLTDPEGNAATYQYDGNNRLIAVTDPLGGRRSFTYDGSGRKLTETAPDGGVTRFEYDSAGRPNAEIDPLGHRLTRTYDSRGNMASETDGNGNATHYAYDDVGRLIQVTDALGGVWTYTYDAAGRLTKIIDANGHVSEAFAYDAAGRLVSETDALANTTQFQYDALGNRTKLIKPDGTELRYVYDGGGRITAIQDQAAASLATLAWDALDRMTSLVSPAVGANYVYDATGRLTQLAYPTLGKILNFTVDKNGRRTGMTLGGDQLSYSYDAAGRMTSLIAPVGRGGQGVAQGTYEMTYDAVGRPLTRKFPNGIVSTYSYDAKGQLLALTHKKADGAILGAFAYAYDANGNRTGSVDTAGQHAYVYDKLNRLAQAVEPFGLTQTYAYDSVGNRTTLTKVQKNRTLPVPQGQPASITQAISYAYDAADRLLSAGATNYIFDAVGRLTQIGAPANQITTFDYDSFDRPRHVQLPAAQNLPDSSYSYAPQLPALSFSPAPLGVRMKKVDSQGVTQYVVDNTGNVAAELDQLGNARRRFTYTTSQDDPLALTDEYGHSSFLLQDGLGSVAMLADEKGDAVQRYQYDAFGQPNVTAQDKNSLKFQSREFDADTQLQYNRARYYSPNLGRWTTRDPLALATLSNYYQSRVAAPHRLNRCTYAENRPVSLRDPSGLTAGVPGMVLPVVPPGNSRIPGTACEAAADTKNDEPDSGNYETDTNIIIAIQNKELNYLQKDQFLNDNHGRVSISGTAKSEVLSRDPAVRTQMLAAYGIRDASPMTPYTVIVTALRLRLLGLEKPDAEIGASAIQNRSRLLTQNFHDFEKPLIQAAGLRLVVFRESGPIDFVPLPVGAGR